MVFPKQAFLRFKGIGGLDGQSLKIGRMEVIDGTSDAASMAPNTASTTGN